MADETERSDGPRWSQLYETASVQEGLFTTAQAAEARYYPQLLTKYLKNGRIIRVRRDVYRLVHFPPVITKISSSSSYGPNAPASSATRQR